MSRSGCRSPTALGPASRARATRILKPARSSERRSRTAALSDPKEIWCANLTVGQYAEAGIERFGFERCTAGAGAVAPNTFTWRTVTLEPIHLAITRCRSAVRHTATFRDDSLRRHARGRQLFAGDRHGGRQQDLRHQQPGSNVRLHLLQPGPVLVGQRLGPGQAARGHQRLPHIGERRGHDARGWHLHVRRSGFHLRGHRERRDGRRENRHAAGFGRIEVRRRRDPPDRSDQDRHHAGSARWQAEIRPAGASVRR